MTASSVAASSFRGPSFKGASLVAIEPGPFVTLQDAGRVGWQRFGVSRAGAMDMDALATANILAGNKPMEAALEFAQVGGTFRLQATSCRIGVAGGHFAVSVDGRAVPPYTSATVLRGQTVRIGVARNAIWGYVAISGGFGIPRQLGSLSTHARSGIGGLGGRAVQAGDVLPLNTDAVLAAPERRLADLPDRRGPVRVVLGPQDDLFTDEAVEVFQSATFRITPQMDRLGYRLDGPALQHARDHNIVSDGLVAGCIQVPGSGTPIVLMRDAQLPGGYPKIATVITADLGRLAQMRPGTPVRFAAVGLPEAQAAQRSFMAAMASRESAIMEALPAP